MLSISPPMSGAGKSDYYLSLAREDYYLKGGEPPGYWLGSGASLVGATGEVTRDSLHALLLGSHAQTGEALVQNAGAVDRQSGWDFTFSAPKSVSVVAGVCPHYREEILAAHRAAVAAAFTYLETEAGVTRRGKGGVLREQVSLVGAAFEHLTSRAQEPQLHTHVLGINLGVRADGTTGTIESRPLFRHKMAAGALYRAELSAQLMQLGFGIKRDGQSFEIDGVPKEVCEHFSTRRREVLEQLAQWGVSGAVAAKSATLATRRHKEAVSREELYQRWEQEAQEHSFCEEQFISHNIYHRREREERSRHDLAAVALTRVMAGRSTFTERDFVRLVAEEAQGEGVGLVEVQQLARNHLRYEPGVVSLGEVQGELRYTTEELLAIEQELLAQARELEARSVEVSRGTVARGLERAEQLSDEQAHAVRHLTHGVGGVKVVSGMAGTGKSTMLSVARGIWEEGGCEVIGMALSGKAARGLETSSGIRSETLYSQLSRLERGELVLSARSVVVVDEAAMVSTRQMGELVDYVHKQGGKLVLVGDAKQLQAIEAGGAFLALEERLGSASLTQVFRQREVWAREASHHFAFGNAQRGLEEYAARGLLFVGESREEARAELLDSWVRDGGARDAGRHLIIAGEKREVRYLNEAAQALSYREGVLSGSGISVKQEQHLFVGDRVLFERNSRRYGVRNGDLGTVIGIERGRQVLVVSLDGGEQVSVPLRKYEHVGLGYAVTTHKAQGMTAERVSVLLGGCMQDRELSYVQVSRGRGDTRLFVDAVSAGENLREIASSMGRSRQKELAVCVQEAAQEVVRCRALAVQREERRWKQVRMPARVVGEFIERERVAVLRQQRDVLYRRLSQIPGAVNEECVRERLCNEVTGGRYSGVREDLREVGQQRYRAVSALEAVEKRGEQQGVLYRWLSSSYKKEVTELREQCERLGKEQHELEMEQKRVLYHVRHGDGKVAVERGLSTVREVEAQRSKERREIEQEVSSLGKRIRRGQEIVSVLRALGKEAVPCQQRDDGELRVKNTKEFQQAVERGQERVRVQQRGRGMGLGM